jgi:hypothetical protein
MSLTTQTIFNGGVQYASPLATAHTEHQFHPLEKHPAYVLGQLLRKAGEKTVARGATLAQKITSLAQIPPLKMPGILSTIHNSLRRWWLQDATPCYTNIVASFPGMDEDSDAAVKVLCDNSATEHELSRTQLSNAGVQGIAAALQQNTALTSLSFSSVYCDTATFANAFAAALQVNRNLKSLTLDLGDTAPTAFRPSPMTRAAAELFFQYLPCSNLSSIDLGFIDISATPKLANILANVPYFPLKSLAFSWQVLDFPPTSKFNLVTEGLGKNRCITTFIPGRNTGLSEEMMLSLFNAMNSSQTLSSIGVWSDSPFSFNANQTQIILNIIEQSPCFLNFYNTIPNFPCFQPDLAAAIQNLTQGRLPCMRDPQCDIPLNNCTIPTTSPSSTSIIQNSTFQAGAGGAGGLLLGGVITLVVLRRKKVACWRQPPELMEPVAPLPVPVQPAKTTATAPQNEAPIQPLPQPPEEQEGQREGQFGEGV